MREYRLTQSIYKLVDSLPHGRSIWVDEEPGRADVHILRGEATQAFCTRMTEMHEHILSEAFWVQVWEEGALRVGAPPQRLGFAHATWEIDDENNTVGELAVPLERAGRFVWMIRAGHVKPTAVAEMNQLLLRIVGDGLWQQRWAGGPQEPAASVPKVPNARE
jgi:hypothetical protein